MPKTWHDHRSIQQIENERRRALYRSIAADRKPYFMRYIYPALMRQYNTYIKNTDRNALREFGKTVSELRQMRAKERSERETEFLKYYDRRMPVGTAQCVMNRICRKFEAAFDGYLGRHSSSVRFDHRVLGGDAEFTPRQFAAIRKLLEDYNRRLSSYTVFADYERVDGYDASAALALMNAEFRRECDVVCPNGSALSSILLELCYGRGATKRFVWSICGPELIQNLLSKHDGKIRVPVLCENGELEFGGERYTVNTYEIGGIEHDRNE